MKQPRRSYKRMYNDLLSTLLNKEVKIQHSSATPTHEHVVYDTIKWTYEYAVPEGQEFDEDKIDDYELVSTNKETYYDRSEVIEIME